MKMVKKRYILGTVLGYAHYNCWQRKAGHMNNCINHLSAGRLTHPHDMGVTATSKDYNAKVNRSIALPEWLQWHALPRDPSAGGAAAQCGSRRAAVTAHHRQLHRHITKSEAQVSNDCSEACAAACPDDLHEDLSQHEQGTQGTCYMTQLPVHR